MALDHLTTKVRRSLGRTGPAMQDQQKRPHGRQSRGTRHGIVAIADQAIVSGVNFLTAFVLARYLSLEDFGYYVLLFAVLLFLNGLQSAVITSPMMVIAPRYEGDQQQQYLNNLWLLQLVICGATGVVTAAFLLVDRLTGLAITGPFVFAIIPVTLVVVTYLGQEYMRRLLFLQRRSAAGGTLDLISYGLQFVAIISLIVAGRISLEVIVWVIGVTSALACVFGLFVLRPTLAGIEREALLSTWRLQWGQGRWLTSGALARWSARQLYLFVTAGMLSPAAAGMLGASRQVLGVTHIFLDGLENFVPATVARRLHQGGTQEMVRWIGWFRRFIIPPVVLYCLAVAIFAEPVMQGLFGEQYAGTAPIVALLALAHMIAPFLTTQSFALRAMDAPRWLFYSRLVAAIVTIVVSIPLVAFGGVVGAAIGLILTEFITYVTARIGYWRVLQAMEAHERTRRVDNAPDYDLGTT